MTRCVLVFYIMCATSAVFLTGCAPCFPGGQPDCAALHRVDVTGSDGQSLSQFSVRLVVEERAIDEQVDCGSDPSMNSTHLACHGDDSGQVLVHAFGDYPAQITITTEGGRTVSQTLVLRMRGGDENGCSCPYGEEVSIQVD